jgi:hypothetical protein
MKFTAFALLALLAFAGETPFGGQPVRAITLVNRGIYNCRA